MIFILLAGLILELIYCYYVFNKDLFSPSAIMCEVFILSTIACFFNIDKWGVDLRTDTVAVILGGNAVFAIVSTVIHNIYEKKSKHRKKINCEKLNYIDISNIVLFFIVLTYFVFSILYIKTNLSVMNDISQGSDISVAMGIYRHETVHEGAVFLPSWMTKMNFVLNVGVYVMLYVFMNNFVVDKKRKKNYLILISIIIYLASSAFTAQRTTILLAFIYALFIAYSLLNRRYQFVQKMNFKFLISGLLITIGFLMLFGLTRGLFGRSTKDSAFDSVTYYMGNSIEALDLFIENPIESNQFGEELFRQPRVLLSSYGLADKPVKATPHLEFRRDANNNIAGNVYTAYRYYIHDFGYASIIIFQIILAIFYGIWYEKISNRKLKNGIDLGFIMYAWFCIPLFRFSITNEFFSKATQFLYSYLIVFFVWKLLLRCKISFKKNKGRYLLSRKK